MACGLTLIDEALPDFLPQHAVPHLRALAERAGNLPYFEGIYLPFIVHT